MADQLISARSLTACCVSLAVGAGKIIRSVASPGSGDSKAGLVDKGDQHAGGGFDPQTIADRSAQHFIKQGLLKTWPGLRIIGEEPEDAGAGVLESARAPAEVALDCLDEAWAESADERLPLSEVCVWVDPLDGTKEFTQERFEFVSVLVGVTLRGRPVAGVIAEPYYRYYFPGPDGAAPAASPAGDPSRVLWGCALPGVGAHVLGAPGWQTGRGGAGRGVVITSRSRTAGRTLEALERLQVRGVATAALQAGGAGHKMARVIDGAADVWLMPMAGTSKWDTCAGEAVLAAAGGAVADAAGGALRYDPNGSMLNSEGVVAACSQRLLDAALDACRHHPAP